MTSIKYIFSSFLLLALFVNFADFVSAQQTSTTSSLAEAVAAAQSTTSSTETASSSTFSLTLEKKDVTKPEESSEKAAILELLKRRPIENVTIFNIFGYWTQRAIELGIPANTIILILIVPIVATLVAFTRLIVGFPSLEMLVPIALSYTFVAIGVGTGLIILAAVLVASSLSRWFLKKVRVMQLPKRAISMFFLSLFVLAALITASVSGMPGVTDISIFPVLIIVLLGDMITTTHMRKSIAETASITFVTIVLALFGFLLSVSPAVRNILLLYPEVVLSIIPINIFIGRYFGLRLTEYFRFRSVR